MATGQELVCAIQDGKLQRAKEILDTVGPLTEWRAGYVLLIDAIKNRHTEIVKLLLSKDARVNSSQTKFYNKQTDTPLHYAVMYNNTEIIKMLLDRNALINARDNRGRTPLHNAVETSQIECIKLFLNHGADVNVIDNEHMTALHTAIKKRRLKIVEILLKHGAYINSIARGRYCSLLLQNGAHVNSRDSSTRYGTTPLHAAVEIEYEKVVKILLEYNADVNSVDATGTMPIHTAAYKGNVAIMKMLINKVADINAKDEDGYSALHIATENYHEELVEILLKYGAYYDSRTKGNKTPLHIATEKGSLKNVLNLLKFGADIDATDEFGKTALQIACKIGRSDIVLVLLENGANINIINNLGLLSNEENESFDDDYNYDNNYGYDIDHEEMNRGKNEIANIFVRHIVKLKAQNLFVNEQYAQSICKNKDLADLYTSCESEVIEMRSEKIENTNITFFDILSKDINQLAAYTKNEDVLHILESQVYQEKFPRYANIVNNRFCKAREKQRLLNSSVKCFNLLFGYELPELFTKRMFRYLSLMDLENLIEAYPNYNNIKDDDQLTSMQDV